MIKGDSLKAGLN